MPRWTWMMLLVACGGPETNLVSLTPEIAVAPGEVAFGDVAVLSEGVQSLFVSNAGQAELIATLVMDDPDGVYTTPVAELTIPRDESMVVPLTFAPQTFTTYDATLRIESNDEESPILLVPLSGRGVDAPTADICIDPLALDFGTVAAGSTSTQFVFVENCGDAPLELGVIEQAGSGAFRVDPLADPSGSTVAGGDTLPVIVHYEPFGDLGDNGSLTFPSNDPDEAVTEVLLLGNGGGDFDYPIAAINCPGSSAPPDTVLLDGLASTDPSGLLPLQYLWLLLDKPDGSAGYITNTITDSTALYTDIAGQYTVQLQVFNTAGVLSAPDKCVVDAIPDDDLHVELTWDTTGVDLDLHLLESPLAEMYDTPEDCTWCNKNPQWGGAGSDDDPQLDLDDQSDGPENINVRSPADGTYPVVVHYYNPIGGAATTATVKVYAYGVEVWSGSKVMTRDQQWNVGEVNWPDGTFAENFGALTTATRRTCQ